MTRIHPARLAWALWTLCTAFATGAIAIDALRASSGGPVIDPLYALYVGLSLAFPTTGAFIAARRPENPIGWLFCGFGVVWLGMSAADRYVLLSISRDSDLPGTAYAGWMVGWGWALSLGVIASFALLLFPDGRLPGPRWRIVAWFDAFWIGLVTVSNALKPDELYGYEPISNPLGLSAAGPLLAWLELPLYVIGVPLVVGASVTALAVRYRRAQGVERLQIKWITYAALFVALSLVIGVAGDELLEIGGLQWALFPLALVNLAVFIAIAILRYRLFDIDLLINRTLVYGALTACVIAIYVGVVGYLGQVLHSEGNLAISLVATGIVAVLFQPLREWLQRGVDRLMYGERNDPFGVMERLGQRLESTLAPDAVLSAITETVAQSLRLPYASIALRQGDTFATAAAWGSPPEDILTLPLVYQSETVGQLELGSRSPGEPFAPTDQRVLQSIAHQAGIAAYAVRLAADLQRSRERIVLTREEERRRLRRDLHDGLGPRLAGLAVRIEAAKNVLGDGSGSAATLLDELQAQAQAAIADIRRVVYDLRPPALDELGLVAALREQAMLCSEAGHPESLQVSVEASEPLPALPAAVEVAAYRIATEALTNVVHHARARTCTIRICAGAGVEIEVTDDGRGIAPGSRHGVGITSMRERAAELGGTLTLESVSGSGTRVFAYLPLPASIS